MQADQRQGNSSSRRRRRRRVEVCSQLLLPAVAAAGLCVSGSHLIAHAFVPPYPPPISWSPRNSLRHNSKAAAPRTSVDFHYGRQHSATMVIGEPPSAACRRALQRAWRASSSEATSHEAVCMTCRESSTTVVVLLYIHFCCRDCSRKFVLGRPAGLFDSGRCRVPDP